MPRWPFPSELERRARTRRRVAGTIALALGCGVAWRLRRPRHAPPTRVAIRVDCREPAACDLVEALALDVWTERRGAAQPLDVVVSSDALGRLTTAGVRWTVLVPDIDAVARAEAARLRTSRSAPRADWFAEYRDFEEITGHLQELARDAPDRVALEVLGSSVEGRPLLALRVGHGATTMLVNGTQHAREWIAAMVTTCVADRVVREYDRDPAVRALVDRTTLWVVPVVNPDGYHYSWSTDRYWRKNRRDRHGVDLNRNFAVAWGADGSSGDERSQVYRGPRPFSEPESAAIRELGLRQRFDLHVDFHAYGQLVLYPWDHTRAPTGDHDRFRGIGDRMASAIFAQHQTAYRLMSGADLYPAAGTMSDWHYGELGAVSYTIELRPRGGSGFVLPPEQIRPTCDEGLAAVLALRAAAD